VDASNRLNLPAANTARAIRIDAIIIIIAITNGKEGEMP
jgi:hypothetical protein